MFNASLKMNFVGIPEINPFVVKCVRECAFAYQANGLTKKKGYVLGLIVDSPGGLIADMRAIVSTMKQLSQVHFSTFATGQCQSAAVPLMACGRKGFRIAQRDVKFMVHSIGSNCTYNGSAAKFNDWAVSRSLANDECEQAYSGILESCSHRSAAFWLERMTEERTYFSAAEALEWGIVDHIVDGYEEAISLMVK